MPNRQSLPALINGLIGAVTNGELDSLLQDKDDVAQLSRKKAA